MGSVFVVEYHHIRAGKNSMIRSPKEFRADLERLYKLGFRPCTVSQYLNNQMDMPPGATPAVFTFDDSNPSQLQLRPDGAVDPNCAVGIWQEFAKLHPDFPVRATFYVLPDVMWGQPKMLEKKLALLKSLGCELGNHTVTHPILRKLSDDKVKEEIAVATDRLEKLGVPLPVSLALPFGVSPKNKQLLRGFDYKGKRYVQKAVFLVGAEPACSPMDPKLDRYRIPRIQAYNGPMGLPEWLDKFERGQVKAYVAP
ncbi:polysaccharide deacetylase [Fimbriimonas ginsengisoli Gsoil 348]|uniref:Polysaccharide deacetylase n=2 Tax=Fimbriimonas ginsengisoli TaxID=1005039 RepID=A0A068NQE0_FIMGI|nr:polysaccharide deacetylase [Fimbriimonas ginsengisoli Gsoil 348]